MQEDSIQKLCRVVKRLRAEDGCAWDRDQTHGSLKAACVEEAAEVVGAINRYERTGKMENLREELGDLLLQVVMQSQIAEEEGLFTIWDVAEESAQKMIRRHPHVFGSQQVDKEGIPLLWEEVKNQEKKAQSPQELLEERGYLKEALEEAGELLERAKQRKGL